MRRPISINIDLQDRINEFQLDQNQVEILFSSVKNALLLEIRRNWINVADAGLNSTRKQYIDGIKMFDDGKESGGVMLTGQLNNMLESGVPAFDIKEGFKKSDNVKYNKSGKWFITIPFSIGTPGANPENFDSIMPTSVYELIRSKDINNGKSTLTQDDISKLPEEYQTPKTRDSVISESLETMYEEYVHKSSLFEGLQRTVKNYGIGKNIQSTYNTFRRAGEMSDPNSWIHKGLAKRNFAKQAVMETDVDTIVNNTVDSILNEFGFGE